MDCQPKPQRWLPNEAGQAAAFIALLLFFAFLPLAALAIDGGMVYMVRRDLQNVADASALSACTDLANGGSEYTALVTATNTIASNLGSWATYVGTNPGVAPYTYISGGTSTNIGSGVSLIKGIEVITTEVRVALQRPAPTVLTQFVGRTATPVTAQARCGSTAGGGLMPIAVQRYDGGTDGTLVDYVANTSAPPYPTDSITHSWEGRYSPPPFDVPVPDSYPPSDLNPGPEVVLVGQEAETNNNEPSMRNLVLLDIRNIAGQNELEYYNGVDTQADAAKYLSRQWIWQHGYPGPYPIVGSEIAILDGASNDYTARAMYIDALYRPGDLVAAIVYDGNVWQKPDFTASLQPVGSNQQNGIAISPPADPSTAVTYNLKILPSAWSAPEYFNLSFALTNSPPPPDTHISLNGTELTGPDYQYTTYIAGTWNGTLRIWSTSALSPTITYLSGVDVAADSIGVIHGASSNFGFGTMLLDFALRSNYGKLVFNPSTNNTVNLITFGTNLVPGGQGCKNVPVHAELVGQPNWTNFFSSPQDETINIPKGEATKGFPLNVQPGAPAQLGTTYTLHFTVGGSSSNCAAFPVHTVDIPIDIVDPPTNGTPDKFVFIQGYSVFRITKVEPNPNQPNTVYAEAVRPLVRSYQEITVGLRPRLIPWN